jgi:hypothetical protein
MGAAFWLTTAKLRSKRNATVNLGLPIVKADGLRLAAFFRGQLARWLDVHVVYVTIPPVTAARIFGQNPARCPGYDSHS